MNHYNLTPGQTVKIDSSETFTVVKLTEYYITVKRNAEAKKEKYTISQFNKYLTENNWTA